MKLYSFEWDDKKSDANLKKHNISFAEAATAFYDEHATIIIDNRKDYGEVREILIGFPKNQSFLISVVNTDREGVFRIISARKSNKSESKIYYDAYKKI